MVLASRALVIPENAEKILAFTNRHGSCTFWCAAGLCAIFSALSLYLFSILMQTMVRENPTTLRRKLSLMVGGLLVGALLCEAVLRVQEPFFHIMARRYSLPTTIEHPIWDHWSRPNISYTLAADDLEPYEFFTNSLGCRHPKEIAVPKPPQITRVLVMGDSFTEGYRYEDTVAPRLENRLNETFAGQPFEVINCGSTTYSPILHYLRLKHQFLALQPDYIILNIDQTDVYDDYWRYRPKYKVDADGRPLAIGQSPPSGRGRDLRDWLKEHSYLIRFIASARSRLFVEPNQRANKMASNIPPPLPENIFVYQTTLPIESEEWKTQVGFCLNNISYVVELCKQHNVPLIITMYPHRQQIKADEGKGVWNREFEYRVEQLCQKHGLNFFSAFDGLSQAFNQGQAIYREKDIHFTGLGQQVWGDLIMDYFTKILLTKSVISPQASTFTAQ
jgi:lysophospholipase L1-like esterase